MPTDQL